MKKNLFTELVSMLMLAVFFYTATQKLIMISAAKHVLSGYPVLKLAPGIAAWLIPGFELFIVLILVLRPIKGLYISLYAMAALTIYVAYMLIFWKDLPCTCGGFFQQLNWIQHLILNASLFSLTLLAIVVHNRLKSRQNINLHSSLIA